MSGPAKGKGTGGPKRGYSWPPFERGNELGQKFTPGNVLSVRHGTHSKRIVSPIAELYAERIRAAAPQTAGDAFSFVVEAFAWNLAQRELIRRFLDEQGPLEADGTPRAVVAWQDALERQGQKFADQLGMTPASVSKILRDLSSLVGVVDPDVLKALKAEGSRIVQARRAQLETGEEPP